LGKAAGFDGIYPKLYKNSPGSRTKEWIGFIFNEILSSSKLPKIFKLANVISILKPVKDGTEPDILPTYIIDVRALFQPMIEERTPVSQVGFRKH
jgi:hypothetical protein